MTPIWLDLLAAASLPLACWQLVEVLHHAEISLPLRRWAAGVLEDAEFARVPADPSRYRPCRLARFAAGALQCASACPTGSQALVVHGPVLVPVALLHWHWLPRDIVDVNKLCHDLANFSRFAIRGDALHEEERPAIA